MGRTTPIKRSVLPLEALEQLQADKFAQNSALKKRKSPKNDIVKANRKSVLENATRGLSSKRSKEI